MEVCRADEATRPGSSGYPPRRSKTGRWTVSHRDTWAGPVSRFLSTSRKSQIRLAPADFPIVLAGSKSFSLLVLPWKTPTTNLAKAGRFRKKGSCFAERPRNREPRPSYVNQVDECWEGFLEGPSLQKQNKIRASLRDDKFDLRRSGR